MKPFDPSRLLPLLRYLLFLLIPASTGIWAWMRTRQAQSWPSTQGTISWAEARLVEDGRSQHWVGELAYSYVVSGEYYSGFHHLRARNEQRAEELVRGWKDRMVAVRYSPTKPGVSVLLKEDQPGTQLGN